MDGNLIFLIVLLVVFVGITIFSTFKRKKMGDAQMNTLNALKVGDKVKTHIGVYGTIKKITETTDGKVMVLETGDKVKTELEVDFRVVAAVDTKEIVIYDANGNRIDEAFKAREKAEKDALEANSTDLVSAAPEAEEKSALETMQKTEKAKNKKPAKK